jgi:hypothetical protein
MSDTTHHESSEGTTGQPTSTNNSSASPVSDDGRTGFGDRSPVPSLAPSNIDLYSEILWPRSHPRAASVQFGYSVGNAAIAET